MSRKRGRDEPGGGVGVPTGQGVQLGDHNQQHNVFAQTYVEKLVVAAAPPPEPGYWETVREFGRTMHKRMPKLLGREQELADIAIFATGPGGYRWLVGGAFVGKTALLFKAATGGLPDDVDVVCYFLSRRASDADSRRFLAAVVPQLAFLCGVEPPAANRDYFSSLWRRAADRAAETGRPLLLVVDGLDEDLHPAGSPSVASLLPTLAEGFAHVLVASRPRPELPVDVPEGHPLTSLAIQVDLQPFEGARELADLARQEIYNLTHGTDADVAVDVLGLLTAAAGPLTVKDLAALSNDLAPPSAAHTRQVRRLLAEDAARSLEPVGPAEHTGYQFAHYSLLEFAQATEDLCDPEYRTRIRRWAELWRAAGWPTTADAATGQTPRYLLDSYPSTLNQEPQQLAELVSDLGWIEAAIPPVGVDRVLANLRAAMAANPASATVTALLAAVSGQASYLRPPRPVEQPDYVLRQLCMRAAELSEDDLANDLRSRLQAGPLPRLVPQWTTRRAGLTSSVEIGHHADEIWAVAALPDGRVVTGGQDGRVLVWDPSAPGSAPAELGHHTAEIWAVAVLPDERVVSGGQDGRVLVWDPDVLGVGPVDLGSHRLGRVAALPDGRVVTGGQDGRVLVWDPSAPGSAPAELGHHSGLVRAVAVLPDGRVVTGGADGRVLAWDPDALRPGPTELGHRDQQVLMVEALPDGRVVTGGNDGWVLVWDPSTLGIGPVELGRHYGGVRVGTALADGRVVTSADDGRVLVWDPAAPGTGPAELGHEDGPVRAAATLVTGVVVTGGADGRVLAWVPTDADVGFAKFGRHDSWVWAAAMLPDGRIVTAGADGWVLLWDPVRPNAPAELGHHDSWVGAVAVLPDGRVVTGGDDKRILVWDPGDPGAGPAELGRQDGPPRAAAALPDGRVVVGGKDGQLVVWDPANAGHTSRLGHHDGQVRAVAVLPDGRVITGGDDGQVMMWNPATPGAEPIELGHHDNWVWAVAVLPDGRVVTSGADRKVLMWDPAVAGGPAELGHHDGAVWGMAVLPDGRVVTGGSDRRVRVWEPGRAGISIVELGCSVFSLAAAPAGPGMSHVVIAHQGNGFSTWSLTT